MIIRIPQSNAIPPPEGGYDFLNTLSSNEDDKPKPKDKDKDK